MRKTKSTIRLSRSNQSRSKKSSRRKYTPRAVSLKAAAWYAKASESFAIKAARP